jgi:hypothetical protein
MPVSTGLWVTNFGLAPGNTDNWFQDGQTFGQVRWFLAHPFSGPPFEQRVEITEIFELVKVNGDRQINVIVRNNGSNPVDYAIFYAQIP